MVRGDTGLGEILVFTASGFRRGVSSASWHPGRKWFIIRGAKAILPRLWKRRRLVIFTPGG
jgi:hypothetical protein